MRLTYLIIKKYEDKVVKLSDPALYRETFRLYQNFILHGMEDIMIVPSDQIPFLEKGENL